MSQVQAISHYVLTTNGGSERLSNLVSKQGRIQGWQAPELIPFLAHKVKPSHFPTPSTEDEVLSSVTIDDKKVQKSQS